MFDPHRTRRSDKRYYTRKGQVLQASRVNTQPIIEQRLVPVYQNYLISNGLLPPRPPPGPTEPIEITGIAVGDFRVGFGAMDKDRQSIVNINFTAPANDDRIFLYFQISINGESNFVCKYIPAGGNYTKTILNNKVCYIAYYNNDPNITSQTQLDAVKKSIVDMYGVGDVIYFYGESLFISTEIKFTTIE